MLLTLPSLRTCGEEASPPLDLLPWTDIVTACIQYKVSSLSVCDENDSVTGDSVICYREEALSLYSVPTQWSASLGWGAEKDVTTVEQVVDNTVSEARERSFVKSGDIVVHNELRHTIRREQKASIKFEKMLECALSENYQPTGMKMSLGDDGMQEEDSDNDLEAGGCVGEVEEEGGMMYTREHVPVISYISPSLGRLVSPRSVTTRLEIHATGMSPRNSRLGDTMVRSGKRKLETSGQSRKRTSSRYLLVK